MKNRMLNGIFAGFLAIGFAASQQVIAQTSQQEFNARAAWLELKNILEQQYAYLDRKGVNEDALFDSFASKLKTAQSKQVFADTAQQLLRNFYDPHLNLGPYNEFDFSVYPTGSDIYVNYQNQQFVVIDVKAGSSADLAGIRPNMKVTAVNGVSMERAVKQVLGRELSQLLPEQVKAEGVNWLQQTLNTELEVVHHYQHFWRYANIQPGVSAPPLIDEERRIVAIGDWTQGGRVEGAFLSAQQILNYVFI